MNSLKYLGIDLSLQATGVCIVSSDYSIISKDILSSTTTNTSLRLFLLKNALTHFLTGHEDIKLCCIEGPSFGSKDGGRLFQIGEWTGVVKLLLFELGIPFVAAVPSQLKKYISGTGKDVKKEHVMLDVYKKYNVELRDNNIADAYVLSRIARDYSYLLINKKLPSDIFQYQGEVLKAMWKTYGESEERALL